MLASRTDVSTDDQSVLAVDRRTAERYDCEAISECQALASHNDDKVTATVGNISAGGLGLFLPRRFEPGTILRVRVKDRLDEELHYFLVRVVHTSKQPEGQWLAGCAFCRQLTLEEIQDLL